jgi:SAM-dependent methyltransferase
MAETPDLATATAHAHWDARWRDPAQHREWLDPDPEVAALVPLLKERKVVRVLDLGCGVGRHALLLAAEGFEVYACDAAEAGLAELRRAADARGLRVMIERAVMTDLPYRPALLDAVLAFNVIYHGDPSVVRATLDQIRRVLHLGGLLQATFLTKANVNFGVGREIAPDTWVNEHEDDKAHPHFYCDEAGLRALLAGFEVRRLTAREHAKPGSWHWHVLAELVA